MVRYYLSEKQDLLLAYIYRCNKVKLEIKTADIEKIANSFDISSSQIEDLIKYEYLIQDNNNFSINNDKVVEFDKTVLSLQNLLGPDSDGNMLGTKAHMEYIKKLYLINGLPLSFKIFDIRYDLRILRNLLLSNNIKFENNGFIPENDTEYSKIINELKAEDDKKAEEIFKKIHEIDESVKLR